MKKLVSIKKVGGIAIALTVLMFVLLLFLPGEGNASEKGDKTLSPYFFVNTDLPGEDLLPLKHTSADVNISGVIANVQVKQVYMNQGNSPLEAIYIFPGSTRAAVYGMEMTIGERKITARIDERQKARKNYQEAVAQGKSASLLEQQRPNVFQMNIGNIMPGDSIVVELKYTELLIPEAGIYEFVYPTVVGPRYSNQSAALASASEQWVENPYLTQGEQAPYSFDINTQIHAGVPLKKITCNSHETNVNFKSASTAIINLKNPGNSEGNRDYIVRYQLAGGQIESGILLYEGKDENFFLAMVQPPKRVESRHIPPREYVFIVDVSGSMRGYPLDISKKLLKDLIGNLRSSDVFNVMLFAGGSDILSSSSLPATSDNIRKAINFIDKRSGGGGTELLPALKRALNLPKHEENVSRTFVIATDGYVSVEKEAFDLIRDNLGNANMFAFGIGTSVNRFIIEGMARVGQGEPLVITKEAEAQTKADKFRKYIQSPVLTNIKLDFGQLEAYDIEPKSIPDVLADRPILVSGKWKGIPSGTVTVKGASGEGDFYASLKVADVKPQKNNEALKYLWARKRIELLDDYNRVSADKERVKEVTDLGLKYSLLTAYTSFVAIDTEVRNEEGRISSVKQPLPLPEGVPNSAVGGTYQWSSAGSAMKSQHSSSNGYYTTNVRSADKTKEMVSTPEMADEKEVEIVTEDFIVLTDSVSVEDSNAEISEANYPGGKTALENFFKKHMLYPESARKKGIEGTVYLKFTVDKDGNIKDVKILQGVTKELNDEAMRLIKLMPKWDPAKSGRTAVSTSYTLPVTFKL